MHELQNENVLDQPFRINKYKRIYKRLINNLFTVSNICNFIFLSPSVTTLFRKSIPTVAIKLPDRNVPSLNRTSRHVLPNVCKKK